LSRLCWVVLLVVLLVQLLTKRGGAPW
jgi:hypothetical protein